MRLVVTRPKAEGARTAATLAALGHEVLLAPLLRIEPVAADLSGAWDAVIVTSVNAPPAIAGYPGAAALHRLPVFAVGAASAEAARAAGFSRVSTAGGNARDLLHLVQERYAASGARLLYLAGEDRAADLAGELAAHGIAVDMRIVYRAVAVSFPPRLIAALQAEDVEAVMHFSRRTADAYVAGASEADILEVALAVQHFCLSARVAEPLRAAGARRVAAAARPEEAALLALLSPAPPRSR
ncbi:MAG: uroporphyrinogen-III synthase [Pseudolabrys sp.]|nr:uroporphyrinogen-III synthase [Pseudolabrys sp.]